MNDNKLGSKPVMVKSNAPRVNLDYGAPRKRLFPHEGNTAVPELDTKPQLWSSTIHATKENGYTNSYKSSATGVVTTHEGILNNPILFQ